MNYIIIDVSRSNRNLIKSYMDKIGLFEFAGAYDNPIQTLGLICQRRIELIILDIELPEMNGLEYIRSAGDYPQFIIVSGSADYALESYDYDIVDYLVKPVFFERFAKAITKSLKLKSLISGSQESNACISNNECICVNEKNRVHRLRVSEIVYIESDTNGIRIQVENRQVHAGVGINEIEELLPNSNFLRIHRGTIVAINRIKAFSETSIELSNAKFSIGRYYKGMVLNSLNHRKYL